MKTKIVLIINLLCVSTMFAQNITGTWYGVLKTPMVELPLVFHISKTDAGFSSTLDSPKQKAFGIPMDSTIFKDDSLFISSQMGISYEALLSENKTWIGDFHQNGMSFPLSLTREKSKSASVQKKTATIHRPQTPKKPYPYISEEVHFKNKKAGITLAGTLTLPKGEGNFPAVILISGSGPQNRNEEIFGHKPFLVIADYLTRNGIAVLRYDDRGVTESEGEFQGATTADFATDTQAALNYLLKRKEIDDDKIGLLGHSEGGMIAPMLAAKSNKIDFLVLLAGPGIPGDELLVQQNRMLGKASGLTKLQLDAAEKINRKTYRIVTNAKTTDSLQIALTKFLKTNVPGKSEKQLQIMAKQISSPWFRYFLKYNPRPVLKQVDIPVLALNGEKDLQVSAQANLQAIENAFKAGGNQRVTTKILPGLNHLFQESETGLPTEYGKIEQTFSPEALKIILNWIKKQV